MSRYAAHPNLSVAPWLARPSHIYHRYVLLAFILCLRFDSQTPLCFSHLRNYLSVS